MVLAADALQPSVIPQLIAVGSGMEAASIADVIMARGGGYQLSIANADRKLILDFRESEFICSALASDCSRFSCAAFQSVANISEEVRERDQFAWALVKLYYGAFYAGHALIRALGEGCSFFYKKHTDHILGLTQAFGLAPTFKIDAGLYHSQINADATAITFLRTQGIAGGAHEAFWLVFGNKLKSVSEAVLNGPMTRNDAQAVFAQLDQLLQILGRKGGFSWLSGVRNDLQYRLQHNAWFPERQKPQLRDGLSRVAGQWMRDPMLVELQNQQWGLLGDFVSCCAFMIALCRDIVARIAERSTQGRRSFARTGPVAFLNDIGVAA